MRESARPRILFVLGWGHSGSTLLDLLIGSSRKVFSVGEMVFLNFYSRKEGYFKVLRPFDCTCGKPFDECGFWSAIDADVDLAASDILYDFNNKTRLRWLGRFLLHRLSGGRWRSPSWHTGDDGRVFEAIVRHAPAGTEYLCDSSKDFARLARLFLTRNLEVVPIFLVRDVRAVASSYVKDKRERLGMNRMTYFGAALRWAVVNVASRILLAASGRRYIHLSYDVLCRDPSATIQYLNRTLDLDLESDATRLVDAVNATTYHNIGGNLLRFKRLDAIRADQSWRNAKPSWRRAVVSVLFGPFNRLWVDADSSMRS